MPRARQIDLSLGFGGQTLAHQPSPFIIRTSSQLVQLTVVATKNHNSLVTDLTMDDFSLREDGKPQKLSTFIKNGTHPRAVNAPHRHRTLVRQVYE